ncbi:aminoglycoside phosphotransferase family protein [Microbacterium sp. Sa4CUA7]|uniref:Aminoglycoside phosphotransferase family protein n=1 Tax=Microbacterium pullorum TaxID=2762236 RepID=A0ABR8S2X6_9MICO|nr:aminoglycoside phosphotransferase family protein [Microbacterium pullorum]MBD7957709.1 aminoglycoside phosphotransferase family protein [Microbacterium pullorum]
MSRSREVTAWVSATFPRRSWTNLSVVSGAFHDVVMTGEVVARVSSGRGHFERSTREWQIAQQVDNLFVDTAVPRVLTDMHTSANHSGFLLSRLPDSDDAPAEWSEVRSTYAELLEALALAPTTLDLPPARTWCGGDRFLETVQEALTPLLGDDAPAAVRAVESVMELPNRSPTLVHGDFGAHNIIWRQGRAHGVIDWDHACVDDPAIDIAPLVGMYGAASVRQIAPAETVSRAMVHRATLPLQVAAAAHSIGHAALRDHALGNFRTRLHSGLLYAADGAHP